MNQSRRGFLQAVGALAVTGMQAENASARPPRVHQTLLHPRTRRQCEPSGVSINTTLRAIAQNLRHSDAVRSVDEHLVENPGLGFVQWGWSHFRHDLDSGQFPEVTKVNEELRIAMQRVLRVPGGGLHKLLLEGLVRGKEEETIEDYRRLTAELVERVLQESSGGKSVTPQCIKSAIEDGRIFSAPVTQSWESHHRTWRCMELPIIARIGVGHALSQCLGTQIISAEDPVIDRKAEEAEHSGEDSEEYQKWVIDERDKYFIECVRKQRRRITHLLVGHKHVLTDDVRKHNKAYPREQMSHLVITPKSVGTTRTR